MTTRNVARVSCAVLLVYGVTWVVASRTVGKHLGVAWMTYAARAFKRQSDTGRPNTVDEAAGLDIAVDTNAIIPVLPAVVLVRSDLTGTFKSGGVSRFTVRNWSLVVVYGVGVRILKAWPLYITPE